MFAAASNSPFYIIFRLDRASSPGFRVYFYHQPGVLFRGLRLGPFSFSTMRLPPVVAPSALCQQHYIRRVNAEEDVQDLCLLLPSLDPSQGVMLLLRSERSLHRRGANSSKFLSHKVLFPFLLPLTSRGRLRLSEGPVPSGFQCIRLFAAGCS